VCENCLCVTPSEPPFGPKIEKQFFYFFSNPENMWNYLATGGIEVTDQPLTRAFYDMFTQPPYDEKIAVNSYGGEFRIFQLDINWNNNQYLGNPPNPYYLNPVYPNPTSVVEMRQAIAYLVNRTQLAVIGGGFIIPIYTPVPPYMGTFVHPEIRPGESLEALTYPYSRVDAEAKLNAGGFPIGSNGWRYWDRNHNGNKDFGEDLNLKFIIRNDNEHLETFGNILTSELEYVKVKVTPSYVNAENARYQVMENKNFHLYTGDWPLDVDPDYLINWNWNYYWHPGEPNNYAGVNDPILVDTSNEVKYANDMTTAITNAYTFQERYATMAASIPLWSYDGNKAMYKTYTGGTAGVPVTLDDGENVYRGLEWEGEVNIQGYGTDNFFSYLAMHPVGYDCENCTIRSGLSVTDITSLNPIYASSPWDWEILREIYESLLVRNPYDLTVLTPWLAESFEQSDYTNPKSGYKNTKINFTLRPDVTWSDGKPLTTADVYFTFVELPRILKNRGLPLPGWMGNLNNILDFRITDPYNFEVLFNVSSIWATDWMSKQIILPKHIWKPIVESGDPTGFAPDPNMIGTGPFRLKEYVQGQRVSMVANSPDSRVQTNLPYSYEIISPKGYWRYHPVLGEINVDGRYKFKIDYNTQPHTINYMVYNFYNGSLLANIRVTYDGNIIYNQIETLLVDATWTYVWSGQIKGKKETSIVVEIINPSEMVGTYTFKRMIWSTIREDITGSTYYDDIGLSTYPYKSSLPSPDCKVDAKDVALASSTFGSYLGHPRWNPIVDITGDYKIDARDVAAIASKFGWRC
jgi:ABC-type transport system substrate-binding protein